MHGTQPSQDLPRRTRGRPRRDEIELIDSELLEAALREFVRSGYGGTSVNQIVRALGISKTTFYARYPSKEALFRSIVTRQIERLSASTALQIEGRLLEIGMGLRAYANRSLEISLEGEVRDVNLLIHSESQRFPELGAAAAERAQVGIDQIAEFIARCAERDGVPVRDPRTVAETFIYMLRGWYVDVLLANTPVAAGAREGWVEKVVHVLVSGRSHW